LNGKFPAMSIVQTIAAAAAPWQATFSNSKAIASTVIFLHLGAMLFGGGTALAADRATLKASRADPASRLGVLRDLDSTHTIVVSTLTLSFVSGLALAASEVENFAGNPVFWTKMSLVALLLVNGWMLRSAERKAIATTDTLKIATLWKRLRVSAILSIVLWTSVVLAGTILVNAT